MKYGKQSISSSMKISLDTNIFVAGIQKTNRWCCYVVDHLYQLKDELLLPVIVEKEVCRNLTLQDARLFHQMLRLLDYPVDYELPPPEFVCKYHQLGLKKGDMLIGAFCEFRHIEYFVSENRHFLKELHTDAFTVINAETFLTHIRKID